MRSAIYLRRFSSQSLHSGVALGEAIGIGPWGSTKTIAVRKVPVSHSTISRRTANTTMAVLRHAQPSPRVEQWLA